MAIRLSGLVSGLDTEAMVQELVSAYSVQKDEYVKAQTKLEWTQEAWQTLNTKIYNLYTTSLSNMRLTSNYSKKSVTVSDSSKVTVTASPTAVNGTQEIIVTQVAKTGYLTGGVISQTDGSDVSLTTKLSSILGSGSNSFVVNSEGKETTISFDGDMTVAQLVAQFKTAGLNASFDETNQRFFISAADSGAEADFSLTAGDTASLTALSTLGLLCSGGTDEAVYTELASYSGFTYHGSNPDTAKQAAFDALIDEALAYHESQLEDGITSAYDDLYEAYKGTTVNYTVDESSAENTEANKRAAYYAQLLSDLGQYSTDSAQTDKILIVKEYSDIDGAAYDVDSTAMTEAEKQALIANQQNALDNYDSTISAITQDIAYLEQRIADLGTDKEAAYVDEERQLLYGDFWNVTDKDALASQLMYARQALSRFTVESAEYGLKYDENTEDIVTNDYYDRIDAALNYTGMDKTGLKISGQDSSILLNGATFTSNTSSYSINGLVITANAVSGKDSTTGEYIATQITVNTDVDGVYDVIKNFLSEYNTLINEMDSLYNASSAKGYEPLTSDEKEAMSESEIEKWEQKVKDALLRRDTTLNSVSSAMKSAMLSTFEIDGKTYSLSTFGIKTLGYFTSLDNEKNAFHIDGDQDDASVSGNDDKLKAAIASDPDAVISFFTSLAKEVYNTLSKKMQSTTLSSAYTVYNDKLMTEEYDDYTKLIEKWEDKIADMEDRYYKQFSAMEQALAQLNASQSALASLLGSSS